jgi:hypothetical protein
MSLENPNSVEDLMNVEREMCKRIQTGNPEHLEWICSWLHKDTFMIGHEKPTVRGLGPVREFIEHVITTDSVTLSWEPLEGQMSSSKDLAYLVGRMRYEDENYTQAGRYCGIWVKEDGKWLGIFEMNNMGPESGEL